MIQRGMRHKEFLLLLLPLPQTIDYFTDWSSIDFLEKEQHNVILQQGVQNQIEHR